ncbi:MAG TPA: hypothetical protein VN043_04875, partial [Rhodanobacter sp.]|nr:hypothetical protein [Rhodanobacter sp.]
RKQEKSMNAINVAFTPLYQTPVYRERLVILCDKPSAERDADYQQFRRSYKALVDGGQIIEAPHGSLEECYPEPWKMSAEDVKKLKPGDKTKLAKVVSQAISQEQFEKEMPHIHQALQMAWNNAHK